ncbi:ADP-ribosylglycohydrolase family protein [Massilia sp. CCM 9210]|uniref:ADP-ribosylglycohydrolase family protein n=1 Tax=Massilia scottii TaxID=3057166 RepID=UPI002796D2AE|nr:ADP-ribosylglycohydrolase family protein [Massilia sp. CCM 9210]MDQ1813099.1 ADP-ribosylglycohydrolase family protein [Massilia sp. CCM 9210]
MNKSTLLKSPEEEERSARLVREVEAHLARQQKYPSDMGFSPLQDKFCEGAQVKAPWLAGYLSYRDIHGDENFTRTQFLEYFAAAGADSSDQADRCRGALLGLALGDTLGVPLEFSQRDVKTVSGIEGGGPFKLAPGYWTDDTSMACCLAYSLITCRGFDPAHQMQCYCHWYRYGAYSPTGNCFDIGNATRAALERFLQTGEVYAGSDAAQSAGNGSLMRLAPVPVYYFDSFENAVHYSGLSSQTTHKAIETIDACRYFGALIHGALHGVSKERLLTGLYSPVKGYWEAHPLTASIEAVALGSYKIKSRNEISSSGYVAHTLEAALWAFHHHDTFRDGVLAAVNLADDSDTVGAVFGQLAGAYFGETALPIEWLLKMHATQGFYHFAQDLKLASHP